MRVHCETLAARFRRIPRLPRFQKRRTDDRALASGPVVVDPTAPFAVKRATFSPACSTVGVGTVIPTDGTKNRVAKRTGKIKKKTTVAELQRLNGVWASEKRPDRLRAVQRCGTSSAKGRLDRRGNRAFGCKTGGGDRGDTDGGRDVTGGGGARSRARRGCVFAAGPMRPCACVRARRRNRYDIVCYDNGKRGKKKNKVYTIRYNRALRINNASSLTAAFFFFLQISSIFEFSPGGGHRPKAAAAVHPGARLFGHGACGKRDLAARPEHYFRVDAVSDFRGRTGRFAWQSAIGRPAPAMRQAARAGVRRDTDRGRVWAAGRSDARGDRAAGYYQSPGDRP